ncbi:MAG: hypothetical protein V1837_05020 [Candidatus Woesearchaeota archaeon]
MKWDEGLKKIVFEDQGVTKVLRGVIIEDDDFTMTVQPIDGEEHYIIIGKRAIVKITDLSAPEGKK